MAIILPTVTITIPTIPTIPTLPSLPISTTMISCVSNPLMIGLNVVKGALSDNLAGLASGGKGRLAALKKTGEDIKGKLKTMILLELPAIPNFKTEYAILLASVNNQVEFVKNALALEKKWGKALGIAVIRGLLDNIGKIDLCKGIPNIDGKLQADGTVIAIPKAQLSPIPAAPPAAHVPLAPTVQNAVTAPTSGNSGVTLEDYNKYLQVSMPILTNLMNPLIKEANVHFDSYEAGRKTSLYVNLLKKYKVAKVSSAKEYEKTNTFTPAEADLIFKLRALNALNISLLLITQLLKNTWYQHERYICGYTSKQEYDTWYKEDITQKNLTVVQLNGSVDASTGKIAIMTLIKQLDAQKDIIIKGHQYKRNKK